MKIIVGDELGLIKCIDANKKIIESKYGIIKKNNEIIGIDYLFNSSKNILSVTHEENFYILDWNNKSIKYQQSVNEIYTSQVVKRGLENSTVFLSSKSNNIDVFQFDNDFEVNNYVKFDTGNRHLFKLQNSSVESEIFLLNKKYPLQIYDVVKNQITWKSKNVPNDELDLMVPIWDTDLTQNKSNPNYFYTSTAFGHVRAYDIKVKPRPISDTKVFKTKINRMIQTHCENYLVVGDTIGHLYFLDKRKNYHKVKCLFGATGAIRDLSNYENTPFIFSVGLDRFLRVYEYKKNSDMPHIYMKNKLNCVLPVEAEYQEEEEQALEYWGNEDKKEEVDAEMEEISDDSDIDLKKDSKKEKKNEKINKNRNDSNKILTSKKGKTDEDDPYDESAGYEDDQDIDNEEDENFEDKDDDASPGEEDDYSDDEEEDDLNDKKLNKKGVFLNKKLLKKHEFKDDRKSSKNLPLKKKKIN